MNKNIFNPQFLRSFHAYLAMFFLPAVCLFALTEMLYIFGVKGSLNTQSYQIQLSQSLPRPLALNIEAQEKVMVDYARENGIEVPEGKAQKGRSGVVLGNQAGYHFVFIPDRAENSAELQVNRPGLYHKMVLLHKAKCGLAFQIFGVATGICLVLLYMSGILLVWNSPRMKKISLILCVTGLLAVVITGFLSF
ncbi:MAG: hypothetical protein IKQ24_09490 [Verrucomicrobia bacterium]|nr:hypothetical protein [Verrucomicrobiota bacterium]